MTHEPSPLKYMGTQSQETVGMSAAAELAAERARARRLSGADDDLDDDGERSRLADAAVWALEQGRDALQSIGTHLRARANTALADYTQKDPLRAMLIAAGAGAIAMIVIARIGRSGARSVRRSLRS